MRLIDADLLIQDAIQEYARSKQYRDAFTRMVNKAPTIEPKRGEWIDFKNGWKCNACEKWNSEKSNFCPNCGCAMRKESE